MSMDLSLIYGVNYSVTIMVPYGNYLLHPSIVTESLVAWRGGESSSIDTGSFGIARVVIMYKKIFFVIIYLSYL